MRRLKISHLSSKGKPIAFLDPQTKVEVIGALPGEEVSVECGSKKRHGTCKGFLKEVLVASAERVAPRCVHVPQCGGCIWQQMDYTAQLKAKEELVQRVFPNHPVLPIIGCEDPWHYRNKMEFSFSQTAAGKSFLGLVLAGGNGRVIDLQECHLGSPWMIDVLNEVRNWWHSSSLQAYHPYRDAGSLRSLTVREAKQGRGKLVMLTVSGNPQYAITREQIDGFVEAVKQATEEKETLSIFLRIHQILPGSPTQFYEMHLFGPDHFIEMLHVAGRSFQFKISPTSFFQPNTLQAERLYTEALQKLQNLASARVFDLYCGTATLSLVLASFAKEVVGIELNPYAVMDAEANKEFNHLSNVTLHKGDVGKVLESLKKNGDFQPPDIAVVDPPRAGLDERALKELLSLEAKQILYLSCYPPSQAENIKVLLEGGYKLKSLQPVDQFPHTFHVENIAYLAKDPL